MRIPTKNLLSPFGRVAVTKNFRLFNLFDVSPQIVEHEWNNALLCVKRAFY